MSFLYQAAGFLSQGKMKMVQRTDVYYVVINITTNGFEFIGADIRIPGSQLMPTTYKNNTGFHFDIPWSEIKDIIKTRERIMHVIIIETLDDFYTILPLDSLNKKLFTNAKKNAIALYATINEAKMQVDNLTSQARTSKSTFCTNCGEKIKPGSDFCGNCGHKFS